MAQATTAKKWSAQPMELPKLSQKEWNMTMVLGAVFIIAALLQLISFNEFKGALSSIGLSSASTWGVLLILIEIWAAAGFFKVPLSMAFRAVSSILALLVSGFWFFENIRLVAGPTAVHNSAFFGRFLTQSPGWWTVIETTIVLLWAILAVRLIADASK